MQICGKVVLSISPRPTDLYPYFVLMLSMLLSSLSSRSSFSVSKKESCVTLPSVSLVAATVTARSGAGKA